MNEVRVQINMRVNAEMNCSFAFTHLVLDAETFDAESAGEQDAQIVTQYVAGYAKGAAA